MHGFKRMAQDVELLQMTWPRCLATAMMCQPMGVEGIQGIAACLHLSTKPRGCQGPCRFAAPPPLQPARVTAHSTPQPQEGLPNQTRILLEFEEHVIARDQRLVEARKK